MVDDNTSPTDGTQDDGMTVRERRAQHAKSQARKDLPREMLRKSIVPAIVILVLAGIATGFYFQSKGNDQCPGHFHVTFAVYVPGANVSTPEQIDFASPRSNLGDAYYQLNRAPGQTISAHMHQSGAEQGSAALGPSQLHFESHGVCVGLGDAMHDALELDVSGSSIKAFGAHAQAGQTGTWKAPDNGTMHFYVQDKHGAWSEQKLSKHLDRQMQDGEAFLIALGDYDATQIAQMQANIPPPISRELHTEGTGTTA